MRLALIAIGIGLLPSFTAAQATATELQLRVIEAHVTHQVVLARGDADASARSEADLAARRAELDAALGRGERIDLPAVRAEVERQLADVEARLREVGATCGPTPAPTAARARRDALIAVRAALERGPFVPR